MDNKRKIPTVQEMINQLRRGKVSMNPLSIRWLEKEPVLGNNLRFDGLVEVSWGENSATFFVKCKSLSTPRVFRDGLNQLKTTPLLQGYLPMLFVPFLSELQLQELEQEGISGIDLCRNGVVIAPGNFAVYRSGGKNLFTTSFPIKNIYRKKSSMVGRVFLLRPSYQTVWEVLSEVNRRNFLVKNWNRKAISLSTVSKVLKKLAEDLIITREENIRVLQPDKLLQALSDNYVPPTIRERIRLKISGENGTITSLLRGESQKIGLPLVATGTSSVRRYTVMQRGDLLSVYCPQLEKLLERLPGNRSDRFPNLELIETEDETVYFDIRDEENFWWASPIQVYLELMAGDKRDQETAEQVQSYLMNHLEGFGR